MPSTRSLRSTRARVSFMFWLFFPFAHSAWAQEKGWEAKWHEIIAAAKGEGKVVIAAPPDPELRRELPLKIKDRFGFTVEYLGGRTADQAARLRLERRAGQYIVDAVLGGIGTLSSVLYPEKMLDPLRPVLVLPEVVDGSKWKKGKLWFMDPEEKYALRLLDSVGRLFFINTKHVRPEEIKTAYDLLSPKWRGKISAQDPTTRGSGSSTLIRPLGFDFAKRLFIDQKPVFSRDSRQLAEWLARGAYPISLDADSDHAKQLQEEGFPIKTVYRLSDVSGSLSVGFGILALMNRAPHPNAARVLINWIASKEGLELYARTQGRSTTRNDIDESFVPAEEIPAPGLSYVDNADWEWNTTGREEFARRMRELLKQRL